MRTALVRLLQVAHFVIVLFVVFGWLITNPIVLVVHLVLMPLMILQWRLNGGRCLLTDWEGALLASENPLESKDETEGFVKRMIQLICRYSPTENQVEILTYGVMALSATLSALRLLS